MSSPLVISGMVDSEVACPKLRYRTREKWSRLVVNQRFSHRLIKSSEIFATSPFCRARLRGDIAAWTSDAKHVNSVRHTNALMLDLIKAHLRRAYVYNGLASKCCCFLRLAFCSVR